MSDATRWAYHVTTESALPGIADDGLRPGTAAEPHGVWFTSASGVDRLYGEVVVRFPWPREFVDAGDGDKVLNRRVPEREIQVLTVDDGWVDLNSALQYGMPIVRLSEGEAQFPGLERRRSRRTHRLGPVLRIGA